MRDVDIWEFNTTVVIRKLAHAQMDRVNLLLAQETVPSGAVLGLEATLAYWLDKDDKYEDEKGSLDEQFGVSEGGELANEKDQMRYWRELYRVIMVAAIARGPFAEPTGTEYVAEAPKRLAEIEQQLADQEA